MKKWDDGRIRADAPDLDAIALRSFYLSLGTLVLLALLLGLDLGGVL